MPNVSYKITVTKYWVEDGEVGRQWKDLGTKDEKGDAIWGYTPSAIGPVEKNRVVYDQFVEAEVDVAAIQRVVARAAKGVQMK